MRGARQWLRGWIASLWLACAVPPAGAQASDLQIQVAGEGNRAQVRVVDGVTQVVLESPSGLGRARAERVGGPARCGPLRLTLELAGLEELRLSYADVALVASLPSGEPQGAARQSARVGEGAEREIGPDSPYWLGVRRSGPRSITAELPRDFCERELRSFSIAWVDFFR